jgi:hypothetical protein
MFNDLTTDSYRIPWLIWIQLIVLILLFALFYFFTIVVDDDAAAVSSLPETSSAASVKGFLFEEIQQIDKPLITNNNDSFAPASTNRQHKITLEVSFKLLNCFSILDSNFNATFTLDEKSNYLASHSFFFIFGRILLFVFF